MDHPLDEYRELLSELTDAQIAEMADQPVADVAAFRRMVDGERLDDIDPDGDAIEAAREATAEPELSPQARRSADRARAKLEAMSDPAPPVVRVRRHIPRRLQVIWRDGRLRLLRRFDILTGPDAAWAWTHARRHVEPYVPPGRG
jgi:hypothetical protein